MNKLFETVKPRLLVVWNYLKGYAHDIVTRIPGADVVFLGLALKEFSPLVYRILGDGCVGTEWVKLYQAWTSYLVLLGVGIYAIRRYKQSKKTS